MTIQYSSALNASYKISLTQGVIALVRKPRGLNPDHAFLLMERLIDTQTIKLARFDLSTHSEQPNKFEISMQIREVPVAIAFNTLYQDLLAMERVVGKSWNICTENCIKLEEMVFANMIQCQLEPGNYNVLGADATIPRTVDTANYISPFFTDESRRGCLQRVEQTCGNSAKKTVKVMITPSGENCYTWCRKMLQELNDPIFKKSVPERLIQFIAAKPSYLLPEDGNHSPSCRLL